MIVRNNSVEMEFEFECELSYTRVPVITALTPRVVDLHSTIPTQTPEHLTH